MGCQPVLTDAADYGWIGRARLWWSTIDWEEVDRDPSIIRRRWRHDIQRIRAEVVDEVKAMIEAYAEETAKSWVRATYSTPDKPAPTQVLVFLELLRLLGYPDVQALEEDMTDGFQMIGDIRPGPGWRLLEDGRYQNPTDLDTFRRTNAEYVRKKIGARRTGNSTTSCYRNSCQKNALAGS